MKIRYYIILTAVFGFFSMFSSGDVFAAPCSAENIRWAETSNRVYISGGATCSLGDIKSLGSEQIPLFLINETDKIWLLGANIILKSGATINLYGDGAGGDVNELRLKSNNTLDANPYVFISAEWGNIDIQNTKITSWDESAAGPDTDYGNGRAFIKARSSLDGDGVTPHESRMDIKNSEIGHLGFNSSESYGLSWKVVTKTLSVFDQVGVFGDVADNKIHDNFFGVYTYGGQGMSFTDNEIYNNIWYGMDPHDDSDFLLLDGNYVHHNGKHGIICSKRCDNLTVVNNISSYNAGVGIIFHWLVTDSLIQNNESYNNTDAGIALFDSYNNTVGGNASKFNKYGIRLSVGSSGNTIENNDLSENLKYGVFTYKGTNASLGSPDGVIDSNIFRNNIISKNINAAIRLKEARFNTVENNTMDNSYYSVYAYDTKDNSFLRNTIFGNARNYYFERYNSQNIVKDTDSFSFKLYDDLSDMTAINSHNHLLLNSKGLATDFYPDRSSVFVNKIKASNSIVSFSKINLTINPDSGQISAVRTVWNTSGDFRKKWTEMAVFATSSAGHTVGDLNPGSVYNVTANGNLIGTHVADLHGKIYFTFSNYGAEGSQTVFEVKQ